MYHSAPVCHCMHLGTFFGLSSRSTFALRMRLEAFPTPQMHFTHAFLLTFFFFLLAPNSLFAIFGNSTSSTPAGILASSSSNTRAMIARISCNSSSWNRVPAFRLLAVVHIHPLWRIDLNKSRDAMNGRSSNGGP